MRGFVRTCPLFAGALLVATLASVAAQQPKIEPDVELGQVGLRFGVNAFAAGWAMDGTWAGLAQAYGSEAVGFPGSGGWADLYVRPSLTAEARIPGGTLRAGLSASWGGTLGTDLYNYSDRSRAMLEDIWLGWTRPLAGDASPGLELRAGRFSECLDGGFLLCQATVNGSERGLIMESPRTSWRIGALARAEASGIKAAAAYLEPQNLDSFNTHDAFAYLSLGYAGQGLDVGTGYIRALRSTYDYPGAAAPFELVDDGRDGLATWLLRAAWRGPVAGQTELSVRAIGAIQRQTRIDLTAWGGYAEAGLGKQEWPLMPRLSLGYAVFSGDDPATARLERFDPLYYGGNGGLDGFFFGVIGPNLFLNSNLRIWRANLDLVASDRDFVKLQALRFEADELNSPLQFGQGVRFDTSGSTVRYLRGVQSHPLGHELLASWTRVVDANFALTTTLSMFLPASGLQDLAGGSARTWYAGGLQLTYRR